MPYIIINNKILPKNKALINVGDRGFRFGDGVFETCLTVDGKIYNWEAHRNRLEEGLKAIKIELDFHLTQVGVYNPDLTFASNSKKEMNPRSGLQTPTCNDNDKLKESCLELIKKNKIKNGYLRIAISRGVGSVGYLPQENIQPTVVIETLPLNTKPKSPIKLCISNYQKPSIKSLPVNYKLMNGLNSTLAKLEAVEKNYFDAILLNEKNQICETSSANIFWIKDDVLYTPH